MSDTVKYVLDETHIPKSWYNIVADLPRPPDPPLHPGTLKPLGPQDLAPLIPMSLIEQEVSAEREIEIPRPVRDIYRQWRKPFTTRKLASNVSLPRRVLDSGVPPLTSRALSLASR